MAALPFEFNGVVRLTRAGTGFLLLTLFIAFAAINTGNNSLYITLSMMLSVLVLSGVASRGGIRTIEVSFTTVEEAWAGRTTRGWLQVTNRSRLWNVRDLLIAGPFLERPVHVPQIGPGKSIELMAVLSFVKRGRVELTRLDLYTRYPFGLFLKKRRVEIGGEVIVYPRLLERTDALPGWVALEGDLSGRQIAGSGTEFFGLRDYRVGDPLRHLHWRKTASSGRWISVQHIAEQRSEIVIAVDPFVPVTASSGDLDEMISEAATLVEQALDHGWEVTLVTPERRLHGAGEIGRQAIFEELALMQPARTPWRSVPPGVVLFRIGDVYDAA